MFAPVLTDIMIMVILYAKNVLLNAQHAKAALINAKHALNMDQ